MIIAIIAITLLSAACSKQEEWVQFSDLQKQGTNTVQGTDTILQGTITPQQIIEPASLVEQNQSPPKQTAPKPAAQTAPQEQSKPNQPTPKKIITDGPKNSISGYFSYTCPAGSNAFTVLKSKANVKSKSHSGLGEFVESINALPGTSEKFWAFYVNGKKSQVGASSYTCSAGDNIEWKYEKIN